MSFNSYEFILVLLPCAVIGYFGINHFGKFGVSKLYLLLISIFMYGFVNWKYLLILIPSVAVNYVLEHFIAKKDERNIRRTLLIIGIIFNVLLIGYFKYYNFFIENLNVLLRESFVVKNIILPVGVSYFSFQQIAFIVDSYKGKKTGYSFLDYLLYISFFAYVTSGPIAYHGEVIPQINNLNNKKVNTDNIAQGIILFIIGLFKKVIIADTFAKAVAWGYGDVNALSSLEAVVVSLSFTMQLFFDFSGYSDMAIGIGRMFNIKLPVNFKSPYQATSVIEFWKGWHITLTRFLREYVYFPLGGSKKGKVRTYINIMLIFLVSGLWHGANWTFIIWGLIHGIANILNRIFKNGWDKLNVVFCWGINFIFINFTWIIFRANSLSQAGTILKKIVKLDSFNISYGLVNSFELPEILFFFQRIPVLNYLLQNVYGVAMWLFVAASFTIVLNCKSVEDRLFKLSAWKAVMVVAAAVWCIVSFSGVTVFLYSNF